MRKVIKVILLSAVTGMLLSACGGSSSSSSSEHVHTYGTEWVYDDYNHWHKATCEHKDEISDEGEHQLVKKDVVEPTATTRGYTLYECSICGFTKRSDYVTPVNPYTARIKSKDFKVINLSYEKQSSNDPRFFDDAKPLANYIKPDTYTLYYLDEINDIYYLPLATYVDLFKGDFKDGVENIVKEDNNISLWTSKYNTPLILYLLIKKPKQYQFLVALKSSLNLFLTVEMVFMTNAKWKSLIQNVIKRKLKHSLSMNMALTSLMLMV